TSIIQVSHGLDDEQTLLALCMLAALFVINHIHNSGGQRAPTTHIGGVRNRNATTASAPYLNSRRLIRRSYGCIHGLIGSPRRKHRKHYMAILLGDLRSITAGVVRN